MHSLAVRSPQPLPSSRTFQQLLESGDGLGEGLGAGVASRAILASHWRSVAKRTPLKHSLAGRMEHSVPLVRTFQQLFASGDGLGKGLGDGIGLAIRAAAGLGDGIGEAVLLLASATVSAGFAALPPTQ